MSEVTIIINGRQYDISCDAGQEARIIDLAGFVNEKMTLVSHGGAAYSDSHLQILSLLMVADELFEAREGHASSGSTVALDTAEVEARLRTEIEGEYQSRLEAMQKQLDTSRSTAKVAVAPAFEDTKEGKSAIKVLKHLSERVNSLSSKLETI